MDLTLYELLLFGHLTFVAAWVGGDIMLQVLSFRVLASSGERQIAFTSDVEWLGLRLLVPASVLVLLFGIGLVSDGDWDMGQFWLLAGVAVFLASAITGAAVLGPETGRISRLAEERGGLARGDGEDQARAPDLEDRARAARAADPRHGRQARPLIALHFLK